MLLTMLFIGLMIYVFGGLIWLALQMAWGIFKVIVTLVFLPIALIGLVIAGLVEFAIPILIVIGIYMLIRPRDRDQNGAGPRPGTNHKQLY